MLGTSLSVCFSQVLTKLRKLTFTMLLEHGLIKSSSFSSGDSAKKNDTEAAIESICKCSDEFDETVQLLVKFL